MPLCVLHQGSHFYKKKMWNYIIFHLLGRQTTTFFLGWRFGWVETSLNQFAHPLLKICQKYPARKLELLSPKNWYIGHQVGIWKMKGTPIFNILGVARVVSHVTCHVSLFFLLLFLSFFRTKWWNYSVINRAPFQAKFFCLSTQKGWNGG